MLPIPNNTSAELWRSPAGGRRASVLMETVLVLPILLMLLGGLFLLGDLLLGKLVVQDAGRHEAWMTDTMLEFTPTKQAFTFAEIDHVFQLGMTVSEGFRGGDGGFSGGNSWGWGRRGYARASCELPFWTAIINLQHDVMDSAGDRMEDKFDLHSEDSFFAPSFDYHRISVQAAEEIGYDMNQYSRTTNAFLLEDELIAADARFARDVAAGANPHGEKTPYSRNPLLVFLSQ